MNQLFNPEYIAISIRREGEGEHCRQQESIFGWLGLAMYESSSAEASCVEHQAQKKPNEHIERIQRQPLALFFTTSAMV